MTRRLLLCGLITALVAPPTISAQATAQDGVLLQFAITRNQTLIAEPALRMRVGLKAVYEVNRDLKLVVSASRTEGIIEATCELQVSDGTKTSLRLKLGEEPTTTKVTIDKDTFEFRMTLSIPKSALEN